MSRQGSLSDLANFIQNIKRSHAFGRLSLRNSEYIGIAHLYYRAGRLVHIVGNRGDARAVLLDLKNWRQASVRFERCKFIAQALPNEEHEHLLDDVLAHLYRRGLVTQALPFSQNQDQHSAYTQPIPRIQIIVESDLAARSEPKQLITPQEWHLLIEATRRASLAVAHLVGPHEALKILQDIVDDCSSSFPAFAFLKISPNGHLQVTDQSHLDHLPRQELIEGFTALIEICQHFCAPIIGERDAHRLILKALHELALPLATLGAFRVDNHLLTSEEL
jgi:hypothetical protein